MTPAEIKAKELIEKFSSFFEVETEHESLWHAKACALICAEEVYKALKKMGIEYPLDYWQQVKEYLTMEGNKK